MFGNLFSRRAEEPVEMAFCHVCRLTGMFGLGMSKVVEVSLCGV